MCTLCVSWLQNGYKSSFVDSHFERVVSRRHVGDVNPLAINVGVIGVVATRTEALENETTFPQIACYDQ